MYSIEIHAASSLLLISKSGFWDAETILRYQDELKQASIKLSKLRRPTRCLIDQRDLPVQSNVYVETMAGLASDPGMIFADRTASIVSGGLQKLQERRMAANSDSNYQLFLTEEEARTWLMQD